MEEESPISKDADISSELLGETAISKKKKKIIIISSISSAALIILITIIIIIAFATKNENKKEPNIIIAEINCKYNIYTTEQSIKLLSDEFNPKIKIEINIDGKNLGFIHQYKFDKLGEDTKIKINIYENIDMDNMFKGIENLLEVEMISLQNTSNNGCKITSMQHTFEGCEKLFNFKWFN